MAGIARVLGFATLVSAGFTCLAVRSVYGDIGESAMRLGRDLVKLHDILGPPQPVVINGTTMFVGGRHVRMSVGEALDHFEEHCQDHGVGLEEEFTKLPEKTRTGLPPTLRNPKRFGILRTEAEGEGVLSCLAAPEGSHGIQGFLARVREFAETGDLARVGRLRYVFAKANTKGGADLVTLWSEGSFNVNEMLFSEGDVPGRDTEGVSRPPNSVRLLSADMAGTGYGIRAFATRDTAARVLETYEHTLPAQGWRQFTPPEGNMGQIPAQQTGTRIFTRSGGVVFLIADQASDETTLHIVEMGTRGAVRAGATATLGSDTVIGAPTTEANTR